MSENVQTLNALDAFQTISYFSSPAFTLESLRKLLAEYRPDLFYVLDPLFCLLADTRQDLLKEGMFFPAGKSATDETFLYQVWCYPPAQSRIRALLQNLALDQKPLKMPSRTLKSFAKKSANAYGDGQCLGNFSYLLPLFYFSNRDDLTSGSKNILEHHMRGTLIQAVRSGDIALGERLDGLALLELAALLQDEDLLRALLEAGAKPADMDMSFSPLWLFRSKRELLILLLKAGARCDFTKHENWKEWPLYTALKSGDDELARLLISDNFVTDQLCKKLSQKGDIDIETISRILSLGYKPHIILMRDLLKSKDPQVILFLMKSRDKLKTEVGPWLDLNDIFKSGISVSDDRAKDPL